MINMAKLKFEKDGISVDVDKEELKEIFNMYFQSLQKAPEPTTPPEPTPKKEVITKVKVIPREIPANERVIVDYIRSHPYDIYKKIGKHFGIERRTVNEIALKYGIQKNRHFARKRKEELINPPVIPSGRERKWLTKEQKKEVYDFVMSHPNTLYQDVASKSGISMSSVSRIMRSRGFAIKTKRRKPMPKLEEIKQFIKDNPSIPNDEIANKFDVSLNQLYYYLPDVMKEKTIIVKGFRKKLPSLIPQLPPQITRKYQKFPSEYYKKSYDEIKKIIMSDKVPEEFRLVDVYRAIFGSGKIDWSVPEIQNRFTLLRGAVSKLVSEGKVEVVGKEQVTLKSGISSARGRYIWKKLVTAERIIEENPNDIFPHTKVTKQQAMDVIKQAVFQGKLTYLKDGRFFGYDMRRIPDTEWYQLITLIAKLVKERLSVKNVKIDFETKGLVFNQ